MVRNYFIQGVLRSFDPRRLWRFGGLAMTLEWICGGLMVGWLLVLLSSVYGDIPWGWYAIAMTIGGLLAPLPNIMYNRQHVIQGTDGYCD